MSEKINDNNVNNQQQNAGSEYSVRLGKLQKMQEEGEVAYKAKYNRTHRIAEARELEADTPVRLCGRLVAKRVMGKLIFARIADIDGAIQICTTRNEMPEAYQVLRSVADLGDFIGVSGKLFVTGTGEKTVLCEEIILLTKALRSLPEKWHGITDIDLKYRQRYLHLISDERGRETFRIRLKTIADIRQFLNNNGFVEVETPMLQNVASGANARPFITHHNALDQDFYLRISPELYLKEVIACGFDRVYELGKNFRNEGMDASHLQEFTMLEWYAAYWDYQDNIEFLKKMLQFVIKDIKGSYVVEYRGKQFDFSHFYELNYTEELNKVLGLDILEQDDPVALKKHILAMNRFPTQEVECLASVTALIDYVFKKTVRPSIEQPTIVTGYPSYLIPLARRNDEDPRLLDMFQLLVDGVELVKAYSELVNPVIQREAFEVQLSQKNAGDEEAMSPDEGFLLAMEHGMPPISGLGIGIDRLVMFLTDEATLRDIILFPIMK